MKGALVVMVAACAGMAVAACGTTDDVGPGSVLDAADGTGFASTGSDGGATEDGGAADEGGEADTESDAGTLSGSDAAAGPDDDAPVRDETAGDATAVDANAADGDAGSTDAAAGDDAGVETPDASVAEEADDGPAPPPDGDSDNVADGDDNCPGDFNPDQEDADGDGIGDVCEPDGDEDGVIDDDDNCPGDFNDDQTDTDGDGIGDVCEPDGDEDGVIDDDDNCVEVSNEWQIDTDGDGLGDVCEPDGDEDGVIDDEDNCPEDFNEAQVDSDGDGIGNACEPDGDGDGIPDEVDLFPGDPNMPGVASDELIYAHTSGQLFTVAPVGVTTVTPVGAFIWPAQAPNQLMTDIAIDSWGTLYGASFGNLFTCHPQTVLCTWLAALPGSFNGLTMVPPGTLEPDRDVLVGISEQGDWVRVDIVDQVVQLTTLGAYGGPYGSSGDAYSILGVGTYAAANKVGSIDDVLVALDPLTGAVLSEIGPISGYANVWGLAGWTTRAFAFDSSGEILQVDLVNGLVTLVASTNNSWWGAGVRTLIEL